MKPKGFWSYARGDDDHLDGVLSELRNPVARALMSRRERGR